MTQSLLIPAEIHDSVSTRLGRLAAKCGVEITRVAGQTTIYRRIAKTIRPEYGTPYQVHVIDATQAIACERVTIGEMPRTNGYAFVGKLVHTDAGNVVSLAPGEQDTVVALEWRNCAATCDHCNTARRRTETFLIRTPDGSIKRVGRNCLADFLMCDPSGMLALDAFQDALRAFHSDEDSDGERGYGGARWHFTTLHFVAVACASIRLNGYLKADESNGGTKSAVLFLVGRKPSDSRGAEAWDAGQPTATDIERAQAVIEYCKSASLASPGDNYLGNLRIAVSSDVANDKFYGLLASAPQALNRHEGKLAASKVEATRPDAGHAGAIGERLVFDVTVVRVVAFETHYGVKRTVVMRSSEGHDLVTFTTGHGVSSEDQGKAFTVKGTVKKHETYQGRAQTVLSRCAFTAK